MPVGVPKVAFDVPGEDEASWIDLYYRLFHERLLFLGGGILSGMAIFDVMQFVEAEVQTVCVGLAASMGSLILLGGEITKRLAFPHAWVMLHQPASSFYEGNTGESMMEVTEIMKMQTTMINIYCQRTGKPSWQIYKDMERDFFMSAEEAQAYGIIDTVADSL
ncbi:unnamed protein product [Vicia faba]|uniref:ATP-dependent Clp protease proteolytic subunit n=1 Tax=Vicia faba TaxID=3906 RepID=A0AAV0YBF7_VICFA|nr:unnamed protein product [Vicia faba]